MTAGLTVGAAAAELAAEVLPAAAGGVGWRELGNKLEAFRHFQEAGAGAPDAAPGAERPYARLWRHEGEGYRRAEAAARGVVPAQRWAAAGAAPAVLLPLHTGAGLSLAARALAAPDAGAGGRGLDGALDRFFRQARERAAPGWEGAVVEALGLVARTLHPHRIAAIDRRLAGDAGAHFWHGVGRGLYFAPTQAVPPLGEPGRRALGKALGEPPDEERRAEAVAGLTWALTLVNLRHPEVLEGFLDRGGAPPALGAAVEHGVVAAALVWDAVIGREATLERFLAHRARGEAAVRWEASVRRPVLLGLERLAPALRESGRWGALFRFRPLGALAAELAAAPAGRGG